jgi:hypothetical protein
MPIRPSSAVKGVYIELAPELTAQVKALAERNGRGFAAEVRHALLRHLAAPPVVTVHVDTPPLPDVPAPEPVKKGRPKKVHSKGGAS